MLTHEQKQLIKDKIDERTDNIICPMCHNKDFIIGDGYFVNMLHENFSNVKLQGSGIPTVALICTNCGFVSQHALGVLGLLQSDLNYK